MLFSIITVCYNSEKTIERAIESVICQTYTDRFEYIFIDGLSTDRTVISIKQKIQLLENRGINVHLISEKDSGIYDAMNKGVDLAQGQYVAFLNSDDWYEPNTLTILKEYILSHSLANTENIISGLVNFYTKDSIAPKLITPLLPIKKMVKYYMPINHPATFVPKSIFDRIGYFDSRFKICADYDFIYRCLNENIEVCLMDEVLTNMAAGGISDSRESYPILLIENIKVQYKNGLTLKAVLIYLRNILKYYNSIKRF